MQLRQSLHQREPETGSSAGAVVSIVDLAERLENPSEFFLCDAGAVVFDRYDEAAAGRFAFDRDLTPAGRKFQGVRDEIELDLLERARIGHKRWQRLLKIEVERLPLRKRTRSHQPPHAVEQRNHVDRLGVDLHLAGFDLGHIEQIVDETEKMSSGIVNVSRVFAIAVDGRTEGLLRDDVGKT
ncbi:MAG: hypothetical protein WDM89_20995 [Rhizomicrobium sp.]